MPTCSQAKIITNLESDIHKRFIKLSSKDCDSNNIFHNYETTYNDSNECFYSIGNKVNNIETNDPKFNEQKNQFCSDYCKSNSTLTKSVNNQPKVNYYTQNYYNQFINQRKQKSFIDYIVPNNKATPQQQTSAKQSSRLKSRRISVDELPVGNNFESQVTNKIPILFNDFVAKKDSVPINFLYNSPFRSHKNSITVNQAKINSLRSSLNIKASSGSDGEDGEEISSGISESNNSEKTSEKSSSSSPVNVVKLSPFNKVAPKRSIDNGVMKQYQKRNIIEELKQLKNQQNETNSNLMNVASNNLDSKDVSHRKLSGLLSQLPKLALESNESTENDSNSENLYNVNFENLNTDSSDPSSYLKRLSLNQAKRLLALASIRPSKTFHKTMTEEEIEVLKKYYELIKPKVNTNLTNHLNTDKYSEPYAPIVYDTAKVKFTSLHLLKNFLEKYKKDIDLNVYKIEYENGFTLKNQFDDSSIKFPSEINDAMFALSVNSSDKDAAKLGEANLYRIVNWNDTTAVSTAKHVPTSASNVVNSTKNKLKLSSIDESNTTEKNIDIYYNINPSDNKLQPIDSNECSSISNFSSLTLPSLAKPSSPQSSTISFDFIKNLSSLVTSVIQPKLQKQLVYNGVDLSTLPGGTNCDIPTFEELGINLSTLLSEGVLGSTNPSLIQAAPEYQSSKLKVTAYKKLKEKVSSNKCMWFNGLPERKPFDVIFEYAGVDIEHQTILDEVNKYLKSIGGHVKSLEFIPRSVHLGSVYVENQWILTLSDQNTKFFTITNGIEIKGEKLSVKSYDEFIFAEYERFIRNEKYKQLIKNHEKAVQLSKAKAKK